MGCRGGCCLACGPWPLFAAAGLLPMRHATAAAAARLFKVVAAVITDDVLLAGLICGRDMGWRGPVGWEVVLGSARVLCGRSWYLVPSKTCCCRGWTCCRGVLWTLLF
jgi:hypothetical protein